ncbi:MAG: hybrid sensor histidine kinase/response regulator [SAR324 cluster bacterium]|nr:hybrid sensor histidine kinase/response regulator [SAR324 cluster bacterium]
MVKKEKNRPVILIVDSKPENIKVLRVFLTHDYKLVEAITGEEALDVAKSTKPDLILLSAEITGMGSFQLCSLFQKEPITHETPIIFLTSPLNPEQIVKGLELGAVDYVTQPFEPLELLARVSTHLSLKQKKDQIKKQNLEQKELLQVLCHDLLSLLNCAQINGQLATEDPEDTPIYLNQILQSTNQGLEMIKLVRNLYSLEASELELSPINLKASLELAVELLNAPITAKEITVEINMARDLSVLAEEVSLVNSVLGNLLTNGIKFSKPGGRVEISAQKTQEWVVITVKDQGIGMPPEIKNNLFDITQSTSRLGTAGEKGTGFGMQLMRKFIHAYGGSIKVESKTEVDSPADHGSQFIIQLKAH